MMQETSPITPPEPKLEEWFLWYNNEDLIDSQHATRCMRCKKEDITLVRRHTDIEVLVDEQFPLAPRYRQCVCIPCAVNLLPDYSAWNKYSRDIIKALPWGMTIVKSNEI